MFGLFIHRYLSDVELLPIIGKLHPSEHYYAKQQADYIMSEVFVWLIWVTYIIDDKFIPFILPVLVWHEDMICISTKYSF